MFINIDKLKPHMFIEDKTLQPISVKPSDLAIDKPIQTREPEPLPIEPKDLQPIEFEPFSNHLTLGNIIGTNVHVNYYHVVPIQDNNANVSIDQNDMYSKALIDVYILGVSNPKSCIHSIATKSFSVETI